ncbi:MAG: hypothetical protein P8I11_03915 [Bacteroidia bacterium]|nr:hypothetical protein [Bacteroidia bacterium]
MKRFFFTAVLTIVFFGVIYAQDKSTTAISNTIQDLIVFTDCEPLSEYEVLDEINVTSIPPSQISKPPINYLDVRNLYIRTVKKMNLGADGIIFRLNKSGVSSAVAIKFFDNSIPNDTSTVNYNRDLFCFIDSKPLEGFDVLGPIINKFNLYNVPLKIARDGFLKRCNKQFPSANAVIFRFIINTPNTAEAVKLF